MWVSECVAITVLLWLTRGSCPEAQELTLSRMCLIDTSDKDYMRFLWNCHTIFLYYDLVVMIHSVTASKSKRKEDGKLVIVFTFH